MVKEIQINLTISPPIHTIASMDDDKPGVEFGYEFASDYRIIPANTVFTSTTEYEIKVDFGVESITIPKKLTHKRIDGVLETNVNVANTGYTRTMQVGVVMSLPQAEIIARYILSQIVKVKEGKNL